MRPHLPRHVLLATAAVAGLSAAVADAGGARVSTVRRPDGKRQVTDRGRPLYASYADSGAGDANGEGFEDVGT